VLVGLILVGGLRPGAWVGFLAVILAHELGHAVLVRRFGQHVVGGVAGQAVLLGLAWGIGRALVYSNVVIRRWTASTSS
jgi:hypothetical protein